MSIGLDNIINDKIWTDEDLFISIAKKIGLNDYSSYDIYSFRIFPCTYGLYISTEKNQWASFREAFVYCIIRNAFILEEWIKPNQKLSSQTQWKENDFGWIDECLYFMADIVTWDSFGEKIVKCSIKPHVEDSATITYFNSRNEMDTLKNGEYRASKQDIDLITKAIERGKFISLYWNSYLYEYLLFGESEDKYILINNALLE